MPRSPSTNLPAGYSLRQGSTLDRALLLKFMHRTYDELSGLKSGSHLANTIEQYFSATTPVWWVDWQDDRSCSAQPSGFPSAPLPRQTIAALWLGTGIDQRCGDRQAHIFLLYVDPAHRRQGIGTALMRQAEQWAQDRGDRQIGLQVFQSNQPALRLYQQLGYQPHSLWMVKPLSGCDRL